ncbi:MAG: hypothetical protein OSB19_06380 [Opitutaceae bacterium]|nr:hypothetical protein [Opitutaceae bacterium]
MRVLRMKGEGLRLRVLLGVWACLVFVSLGRGETRVEIEWVSAVELVPGDLLEVKVLAFASEYSRYDLVAPRDSALRFVATQAFPVTLNEASEYESKWVVVYQALQSGEAVLAGGYLETGSGDDSGKVLLSPLEFEISGFGTEADHDGVERFGADSILEKIASKKWMIALLVGMLGLFYFIMRVKQKREVDLTEVNLDPFQIEVATLLAELNSEKASRGDLEGFLERFRSRCSPLLVREIELFVYSKNGNTDDLAKLIGKELAQ